MPPQERWNHNNHYHDLLIGHVGAGCECVLDVGCGHGFFAARLAEVAGHVDAIDLDRHVVREASRLHPSARIDFRQADFLTVQLPAGHYDAVTSIACLHHMDLAAALREARRVLCPGGRLVVLGLYRETSLADYAISSMAVPANLLHSMVRPGRGHGRDMTAPICAPSLSLPEIRTVVSSLLPGATLSRRLYWRYSLVWQKPLRAAHQSEAAR